MSSAIGARIRHAVLVVVLTGAIVAPAAAQSAQEEPFAPVNRRVESSDLAPVQLPTDLWRGVDAAVVG
jgi:hypothetical protein